MNGWMDGRTDGQTNEWMETIENANGAVTKIDLRYDGRTCTHAPLWLRPCCL